MKYTLEGHKFFPYVAWGIIIGFALFVGFLAAALNERIARLEEHVYRTSEAANSNDSSSYKSPKDLGSTKSR